MSIEQLPNKVNKLTVHAAGEELGLLTHGSVHHYQPVQTEHHVSLTMANANLDGYSSGSLHPIFSQNLPEGFNRRFIAQKLARYAKVDDMYLLALQGENGIGMLSYRGDLQLPEIETVTLLTVNEFVCMETARYCGLEPPKTYLSQNLETFVIERFDRPDGVSLGYEDFTTLLKKSNTPDAKYSGSYENLLKATQLYTNNFDETRKMYQYIVFNCLIGNSDAHLKNYALQYTPDMKRIFVSPLFDVTHTIIYDHV